jgi:hypothetical protein
LINNGFDFYLGRKISKSFRKNIQVGEGSNSLLKFVAKSFTKVIGNWGK